MSEEQQQSDHRTRPKSEAFRSFIAQGWAERSTQAPARADFADYTQPRREALSAQFPGERLVIPAGGLKVRSNDSDYVFRPHSAFAHLTGLGADREPDAVLVMEPIVDEEGEDAGHEPVLFFRPLAGRDTEEFFADSRYGEFWVGGRPTLSEIESELGVRARHIDEFPDAVAKDAGSIGVRVVRDADAEVRGLIDQARSTEAQTEERTEQQREMDAEFARQLSTSRMVKDDYEIQQMRDAVEATGHGFDAVIADLPEAIKRGRGERWVEGIFGLYARHEGNGVGYDSICASGDHANTLHWIKNTGDVKEGDLLLLDAGVEVDSLYTADITRTLPVSGTFSDVQRKVYDAVYAAQCAGFEAIKPGNKFSDVHAAAIRVIAEHLNAWGLLPDGVGVEETLNAETGMYHRRWMVHGTSHHLGLDVHDCARARAEDYVDGELRPGMILTVEPGLYFKSDDLLVPEEFRGIGVRIEDDVLVTDTGYDNLSGFMPRSSDEVEAWIAGIWAKS
ncbi:aminopeptidase P N-terminal domain-containing protein [Demetria terragena]|uniref:aminopeptidase P family protein n=1 Tax=Demetria terragena TaxID=63959 RepID=UPI0003752783